MREILTAYEERVCGVEELAVLQEVQAREDLLGSGVLEGDSVPGASAFDELSQHVLVDVGYRALRYAPVPGMLAV